MTLPSSGPLSLNDIQNEFGGSNPISLSEYYAGGTYVPSGTSGTNGAVPSSGQIGVANFYGTHLLTLTSHTILDNSGGLSNAVAKYKIDTNGIVYDYYASTYTAYETWCPFSAQTGNYEVYVSYSNSFGSTPVGTFDTWLALSSSREWSLTSTPSRYSSCDLNVQIRRIGGSVILASATITLQADANY